MTQQQPPPGSRGPNQPGRRSGMPRNPLVVLALILAVVILFQFLWGDTQRVELNYSRVLGYIEAMEPVSKAGKEESAPEPAAEPEPPVVEDVIIRGPEILGFLIPPSEDLQKEKNRNWKQYLTKDGRLPFRASRLEDDEPLSKLLQSRGIEFKVEQPRDWSVIFLWGLPILLLLLFLVMMFRSSRMTGENVLSFGRARAKIVGEEKTGVVFDDVAGADESKEELSEIVEFLKEPERFTSLGGKIPKGVLLVGPPGCGKTLLARAVAGEAGVPFFSISGSDFVEMFVGVGAARVRDLFNTAKQKAPCIIFVDEIDAVGRHRGTGLGGGHDEREQTLNQLLVEMDGFDGRKGVIVVAATNRPDILDPALLRPGRFDRHVVLDAPDLRGRERILEIHARGKPIADDVNLGEAAKRTPGFSGADLANVMNEAALLAARRKKKVIARQELNEAVERVVAGPERRSRIIGPQERKILAYHELGHALVARFSEHADPVHKISIIPRGKGALGYTLMLPDEDRYIITKEQLMARVRVSLGGRSAEEVVFGHQSTGAEDDLQKVTQLVRSLVCRWGMTDSLGPVTYDNHQGGPFLGREMSQSSDGISEATAARIDNEIRTIVDGCHKDALEIIRDNRDLLDRLAEILIEREIIDMPEFEQLVQKHAKSPPPPLKEPVVTDKTSNEPHFPEEPSPGLEGTPGRTDIPPGPLPPPEPSGA